MMLATTLPQMSLRLLPIITEIFQAMKTLCRVDPQPKWLRIEQSCWA
jgi:hypothetical protein